jgi:asparagine N-glycosylation enzyme membrane subunit Stt3
MIDFFKLHRVTLLWAVFTVWFVIRAIKEWRRSSEPLTSTKKYLEAKPDYGVAGFGPLDMKQFVEDLNAANRESHVMAAKSYFSAALAALASVALSLA